MKKTIRTVISIGMCAVLVVASTGCSAFNSKMQTMNISCKPIDATLIVNGQKYDSPAKISVKRNDDVSIQCYKEGFAPYQRTIGYHLNGTGVLDIVGTALFLIPAIGLFTAGAWSLDETEVPIMLIPK